MGGQEIKEMVPEEHILIMKEAVEDHRASNKHVLVAFMAKL